MPWKPSDSPLLSAPALQESANGTDGCNVRTAIATPASFRPFFARLLAVAATVVLLRVVVSVLAGYGGYLPPDFTRGFLIGREASFPGTYAVAFYAHIAAGPVTLLLGLLLLSRRVLRRPRLHRRLGRVQGVLILTGVVPAGLRMAWDADGGPVAAAGFAALAVATGTCVLAGWRAAVRRQFAAHEVWMRRCFAVLCSAVVVRLWGGLTEVLRLDGEWPYVVAAWACWLGPLAGYEVVRRRRLLASREVA